MDKKGGHRVKCKGDRSVHAPGERQTRKALLFTHAVGCIATGVGGRARGVAVFLPLRSHRHPNRLRIFNKDHHSKDKLVLSYLADIKSHGFASCTYSNITVHSTLSFTVCISVYRLLRVLFSTNYALRVIKASISGVRTSKISSKLTNLRV